MKNFIELLQWIYDNWATIATVAVLIYGIYKKAEKSIKDWRNKTEEEKQKAIDEATKKAIDYARNALGDYILALVAKAEIDWKEQGDKLGDIKRAQVIAEVYAKYPILEQVADKEELLAYIDQLINDALKIVRDKIRKEAEELKNSNSDDKITEEVITEN